MFVALGRLDRLDLLSFFGGRMGRDSTFPNMREQKVKVSM